MRKSAIYPQTIKASSKKCLSPIKKDSKAKNCVKGKKKNNYSGIYSGLKAYAKFLLSHFFASLALLLIGWAQKIIDRFCFMSPVCICNNNFPIKLYTTVKIYFLQWCLPLFLIGNFIFMVKEFDKKQVKLIYYVISSLFIFGYYLIRDGDNPSENDTIIHSYLIGFVVISFLILLIKHKFSFCQVFHKFSNQLGLTCLQYIDFIFCSFLLYDLQSYFEFVFSKEGKNVYQIFLTVYYQIWFSFAKIAFIKFGRFAIKQGVNKYYVLQYSRYFLLKIFALNLITSIRNSLSDWNIWLLFLCHIFFLLRIYLKFDPFIKIFQIIRQKLKSKKDLKKSKRIYFSINLMKKFENKLGLYVFDFQHIVIIRLNILWLTNQWFALNRIEFYQDCAFTKNSRFYIDNHSLIVFSMINIAITLIHIILEKLKKRKFLNKEVLLFKNWIFIILFYHMLEVQIQEYYGILISI